MDRWHATHTVDVEQFCSLALSRREVIRSDDAANGIRGLVDVEGRVRYVIQESQLFDGSCQPNGDKVAVGPR